ncbi:MAG: ThuA domain-containing protein, partial [Planctomycetota bacterium]
MGTIEKEQLKGVLEAVKSGIGIAGLHGGMGDSFRQEVEWQWMVGGQWVAHPGGADVTYDVNIIDVDHEITRGVEDFTTTSEQYLMHVDPGNHVLAITHFGHVAMPVSWTK